MAVNSRLTKIAGMIRIGDRVADIGTDHAYLPVFLIREKIASYAYACDVADGPLLNAKANIERLNAKNIELRKGDGLNAVEPNEADTFIIAGMGGDLIIKILSDCDWIKNDKYELILQPMTSVEDLHAFLFYSGFEIINEQAVISAGRVYSVIKAIFCGVKRKCSAKEYYLGRMTDNIGPAELVYIKRKRRILAKLAEDIKNIESKVDRYNGIIEVIREIDELVGL